MSRTLKLKNLPSRIYLQVGEETESGEDFNQIAKNYEVTWCDTRINKNDIVYVRAKSKEAGKTPANNRIATAIKDALLQYEMALESKPHKAAQFIRAGNNRLNFLLQKTS